MPSRNDARINEGGKGKSIMNTVVKALNNLWFNKASFLEDKEEIRKRAL